MVASRGAALASPGRALASVNAFGRAEVTMAGPYSPPRGGQYSMPGDAAYRANPNVSMTDHRHMVSPSRLVNNNYEDARMGGSPRDMVTAVLSDYSRAVHEPRQAAGSHGAGSSGSSSNLQAVSPRKAILLQGSPSSGAVSSSKEEYARL